MKTIYSNLIAFIIIGLSLSLPSKATDYTLSSSNILITTPGNHKISGSGSGEFSIDNSTENATYTITLDNISIITGTWSSAINLTNRSTTPMTVNFNVVGTNYVQAGNHPGVYGFVGTVNLVFTTSNTGSFTSTAGYSGTTVSFGNPTYLKPSIASDVVCTATLGGVSTPVATALTNAFSQKPLVLSLTKLITEAKSNSSTSYTVISHPNHIHIFNLQSNNTLAIYDLTGKLIHHALAKSENIELPLDKGFYVVNAAGVTRKIVVN